MKSLLVLICVTLIACSSNEITEEVTRLETDRLVNCWTHSMEEDTGDGTQIFRPCDSQEFPVSRFRMTMTLRTDGSAEYLEMSPVDAHQLVEGGWRFDESINQLELLNDKQEAVFRANVEGLESGRMALRRV